MDNLQPEEVTKDTVTPRPSSFFKRFWPHIIVVVLILIASTLYFSSYILKNNPHPKAEEHKKVEAPAETLVVCSGEAPTATPESSPTPEVTEGPQAKPQGAKGNGENIKTTKESVKGAMTDDCNYYGPQGIQDAIDAAADTGDTVFIHSGTYDINQIIGHHNILISNKNITLEGDETEKPVLSSVNVNIGRSTIDIIGTSQTTIENFKIEGANHSITGQNGIYLNTDTTANTVIQNNEISNAGDTGISITAAGPHILISKNIIKSNIKNGIISNSIQSQTIIEANTISNNNQWGIKIGNGLSEIRNNIIADNTLDGIRIIGSAQSTIVNNVFNHNLSGILLGTTANTGVTIKNNILTNNQAFGINTLSTTVFSANLFNNLFFHNISECAVIPAWCEQNSSLNNIDPLFVSEEPDHLDFHLRSGSQAVDAGDSNICDTAPVTTGSACSLNSSLSRSDMGAYGGPDACGLDPALPGC